jgi:hypothetical protein
MELSPLEGELQKIFLKYKIFVRRVSSLVLSRPELLFLQMQPVS